MDYVQRVNINGTNKQELVDGYMKTWQCLADTIEQMRRITPHGRDYQTYENAQEAYKIAREAHDANIRMLQTLQQRMLERAAKINEQ